MGLQPLDGISHGLWPGTMYGHDGAASRCLTSDFKPYASGGTGDQNHGAGRNIMHEMISLLRPLKLRGRFRLPQRNGLTCHEFRNTDVPVAEKLLQNWSRMFPEEWGT